MKIFDKNWQKYFCCSAWSLEYNNSNHYFWGNSLETATHCHTTYLQQEASYSSNLSRTWPSTFIPIFSYNANKLQCKCCTYMKILCTCRPNVWGKLHFHRFIGHGGSCQTLQRFITPRYAVHYCLWAHYWPCSMHLAHWQLTWWDPRTTSKLPCPH